MGYLDQTRKNKRSTQPTPDTIADKECDPATQEALRIANIEEKPNLLSHRKMGSVYNDQTGRLPINSIKGNKYVCLLYYYDANVILKDTLNNCIWQDIMRAYLKIHIYLTEREFQSKNHWLDNEARESIEKLT